MKNCSVRWRVALILLLVAKTQAWGQSTSTQPYAPLPHVPAGWTVRQVTTMPSSPVRITSDGSGKSIIVLSVEGDLYQVDLPGGAMKQIVRHQSYAQSSDPQCIGLTRDRDGRTYVVANAFDFNVTPAMNHVTIYRGVLPDLKPWFKAEIPFGIDVFQHGVSFIAQGPDGMMYVSSGSRTDHGEKGNDPKRSTEGETPITSCIWKLDPKLDPPRIEIFARGLRNAFGFCFDHEGRMWATENGPNADPAEELNLVEAGKHYGFPYVFADWDHKAYDDQIDLPPGLKTEPPVAMFDPHSSPSGIVELGEDFPARDRGSFLVARFGNLIGPREVGFDIVQVRVHRGDDGRMQGEIKPFASPVARPTDLHHCGNGKIYVAEFWRQIHNAGPQEPGRILEISSN